MSDLKFCVLCEDYRQRELTRYFYSKRLVTSPTLEFYACYDCITNLVFEKIQNKAHSEPTKGQSRS